MIEEFYQLVVVIEAPHGYLCPLLLTFWQWYFGFSSGLQKWDHLSCMRQHAANQTLVRIPNYLIIFGKLTRIKAATGGVLQSCKPDLLKKSLWDSCFPVNFAKFLRTSFLQNTSGRLLLSVSDLNQIPKLLFCKSITNPSTRHLKSA